MGPALEGIRAGVLSNADMNSLIPRGCSANQYHSAGHSKLITAWQEECVERTEADWRSSRTFRGVTELHAIEEATHFRATEFNGLLPDLLFP